MGAVVVNSSCGPEVTDPPCTDLSAGRILTRRGGKVSPPPPNPNLPARHQITGKSLVMLGEMWTGWRRKHKEEGWGSREELCFQEGTQMVTGA